MSRIFISLTVVFALLSGCTDYEDALATADRVEAVERQMALESVPSIAEEAPSLPTDEAGNELPDPDQGISDK